MGSKKTWSEQLAKRCREVDWEANIASGSGHYKVKTHTGKVFSFSASPSDRYAEKNAIRQANLYGLAKRETAFQLQRERDRLQRIADDRASVKYDTPKEANEMTKNDSTLGDVDGVAIVTIEPARLQTPRTSGNGAVLEDAEALLLDDERTVYRCTKPKIGADKGVKCHKTLPTAQGIATHGSWHDRWERGDSKARDIVHAQEGRSKRTKAEPGIVAQLETLIDDFESFSDELGSLCDNADLIKADLHKLIRELPSYVADPTTTEKARMYDELRNMLK